MEQADLYFWYAIGDTSQGILQIWIYGVSSSGDSKKSQETNEALLGL